MCGLLCGPVRIQVRQSRGVSVGRPHRPTFNVPEAALLAIDQAMRGEHGGARPGAGRPPSQPAIHEPVINVDNVNVENQGAIRPTGNSADAGRRRLDREAGKGDAKASELQDKGVGSDPTPLDVQLDLQTKVITPDVTTLMVQFDT